MKVQKHINIPSKMKWCRCSRVELSGDIVTWELSGSGEYDLLECYQRRPHMQLVKATDDKALLTFVKAWGPLRHVYLLDSTSGTDPIDDYRIQRDLLTAEIQLIASIVRPEAQQSALMDAISAFMKPDHTDPILIGLRHQFGIPNDKQLGLGPSLQQWTLQASAEEIRAACAYLVSFLPVTDYSLKLRLEHSKRGDTVRAWPGLSCLVDALHWMVWQDVFQDRPFLFCDECGSLFQPSSKHKKTFCTPQCGRRNASRNYARRKRVKERKADGTQKTR